MTHCEQDKNTYFFNGGRLENVYLLQIQILLFFTVKDTQGWWEGKNEGIKWKPNKSPKTRTLTAQHCAKHEDSNGNLEPCC